MKRRIAFIFGASSGHFSFKILPDFQNWACGFSPETSAKFQDFLEGKNDDLLSLSSQEAKPDTFYYHALEIASMPEDEVLGVTHHEASHAEFTDFRLFLLGQREAVKEGKLSSTWAIMSNGAEDGRINRIKSESSSAGAQYLQELYRGWLTNTIENAAKSPLTLQFALNCVHLWLKGDFIPSITDKRVTDVSNRTKDALNRYIQSNDAEAAHKIFQEEIWPIAKELEDAQTQDNALREMKSKESGRGLSGMLDKLKKRLSGEDAKDEEASNAPLSEEERKELKKAFDSLPDGDKKKLLDQARKSLDDAQAAENNKNGAKAFRFRKDPKSGEQRPEQAPQPTEEEARDLDKLVSEILDEERERELEEERERLRVEREKREREQAGFSENEDFEFQEYKELWAEVAPQVNQLVKEILEILPKSFEERYGGEFYSGKKISVKLVIKRAPVGDLRVYKRRTSQEVEDPLVDWTLLIDDSDSMGGQKVREAKKAALLLLAAFDKLGLPASVSVFGSSFETIKRAEEDFNQPLARIRPKIIEVLQASHGGTNIGEPLSDTHGEIKARKRRHPETTYVVSIISDGSPTEGPLGDALKEIVRALSRDAALVNINIAGTARDLTYAREIFGAKQLVNVEDISTLPAELKRIMRRLFSEIIKKRRM